jgi:hypothetical protein
VTDATVGPASYNRRPNENSLLAASADELAIGFREVQPLVLILIGIILHFLINHEETIGAVSTTTGLIVLKFKSWPKVIPRWRERQRKYRLAKKLNAQDYIADDIERAVIYYLDPECQVVDPGGQ